MEMWKLNRDGFVMNYMLAGPCVSEFQTELRNQNQLKLEAQLRRSIVIEKPRQKNVFVKMGQQAECGAIWNMYYSHGNPFVDRSAFYSVLQKIKMDVAVTLWVPEDMKVSAALWTYMSASVYCNGRLAESPTIPVYKPICRKELVLELKQGENLIYIACENLGVRDTRNIVALQILENRNQIFVQLPDKSSQEEIEKTVAFLDHLAVQGSKIIFAEQAPAGTEIAYPEVTPDYRKAHKILEWNSAAGLTEVEVSSDKTQVQIRVNAVGCQLLRQLEITDHIKPQYVKQEISESENFDQIMERIAEVHSLNRGEFGFGMANLLARKYCGKSDSVSEREMLLETLDLIEQRVDCSDFIFCGLLRYIHEYKLDKNLEQRIKEVLLNYRYGMEMEGADAMCFWSENHALLFYICAMEAGKLYPQEYFVRASMTGEQLYQYGLSKVSNWLEDIETYSFEEFLSSVYTGITFMALDHLIDYGEPLYAECAKRITDQMLTSVCCHVFKGVLIAPMGRVYRNAIYPFAAQIQAIVNLIDLKAPYSFGEGWLGYYGHSHYKLPENLREFMKNEQEICYRSGNAVIKLEKNDDYCLTSAQSLYGNDRCWENVQKKPGVNLNSHEYLKSLNECFHGTTCLRPGVYGYQQHLWYGALEGDAVLFVNHPGSFCDASGMRPGYWHGNGVLPALKQVHGMIGMIYWIPKEHPVSFTHIYCPKKRFDQVKEEAHWIFMQKKQGYMALWCSEERESYNDMIFECEMRVYSELTAYICVCRHASDYRSFEEFIDEMKQLKIQFDRDSKELMINEACFLNYIPCCNETQYVD